MRYYKCNSNNSTATDKPLKSCIVKCKKGLKSCWRFEKEQDNNVLIYPEDRRSWIQRHWTSISLFILSSFIIPKFFL